LLGWIVGWNMYYLVFSSCAMGWLLFRSIHRAEIKMFHALALGLSAALVIAPFAIRYGQLAQVLGGYRAFESYGTAVQDLLARTHRVFYRPGSKPTSSLVVWESRG